MKLRSYLPFAAIAMGWAADLNAETSAVGASVSSIVSCVSKGKERQQCPADTRAGIVMLRPTGAAACLLGRNWGYDDQGVWVSEGCGGEFGTGSTSRTTVTVSATSEPVEPAVPKSELATVTTGVNPEV